MDRNQRTSDDSFVYKPSTDKCNDRGSKLTLKDLRSLGKHGGPGVDSESRLFTEDLLPYS